MLSRTTRVVILHSLKTGQSRLCEQTDHIADFVDPDFIIAQSLHLSLDEPGGIAWLDDQALVVCDTGHRRLVVVDRAGAVRREIELPQAWSDYYSRPQATSLGRDVVVVSDTPGKALWLVRGGSVSRLALDAEGIAPTGVDYDAASRSLVVGDLSGRVWWVSVEEIGGVP